MNTTAVPIIDINRLDSEETLQALDTACREWGFFQVVEHGIEAHILSSVRTAMESFFAQPLDQKNRIARSQDNHWGYYDRELTKNILDWKEIYDCGPAAGDTLKPQWPAGVPGFRSAILDYHRACELLCKRLISAIGKNLGAAEGTLGQGFDDEQTSFVRLNYYPPCPQADTSGALGVNPHTDAGALTCLLQDDQAGLEVYKDGHWRLVEPCRSALVINIGDIVQVWSNDRYKAALHRAITNSTRARYSAPFFMNPAYSMDYKPLPSVTDELNPAKYGTINWGDFRSQRASGDYADYGEEVQISHYLLEGAQA
jgi:isopenicillin N synthase-like dioxygenase